MGTHKPIGYDEWTVEAVEEGLKRFLAEHGHYPTCVEINKCPYLCTAKTIERKFGGVRALREKLGMEIVDYSKGAFRSKNAERFNVLSVETERMVRDFLVSIYGEICVHEQKTHGITKQRLDFFVYAQENFAVDVFNTYSLIGVNNNLNNKLTRYRDLPHRLYFVVTGGTFSQMEIDKLMENKKIELQNNMRCLTFDEFKIECQQHIAPIRIDYSYNRIYQKSP